MTDTGPSQPAGSSPTAAMSDLQHSMAQLLTRHPALGSHAAMRALVRRLARQHPEATPHPVDVSAPAPDQLRQLLTWCTGRPERAEALADVLDYITGDADTALPLRTLADRLAARKWLEDEELQELQRHLLTTPDLNLPAIAQACLPPLAADLPRHCTTAWSTALHLLRRNVLPSGLPPFMAFLEYLSTAHHAQRQELQTWTWNKAEQWGLLEALGACRAEAESYTLPQPAPTRVMFVFLPDGLQDDYYTLRVWHREGTAQAVPALRDEDTQAVGQRDLASAVYDRLQQWVLDAGGAAHTVTIEFWLPLSLVNQPVWEWCTHAEDSFASQWRIVIRSLDRFQTPTIQHVWRSRWASLMSEPAVATPEEPSGAPTADAPEAAEGYPVILRYPPDKQAGRSQFMAALRNGAPAILWHRHDCSDAFLTTARRLIDEGPLSELPSRISALRARTLLMDTPSETLRDITLLWDDPSDTLPALRRLVPPAEANTQ